LFGLSAVEQDQLMCSEAEHQQMINEVFSLMATNLKQDVLVDRIHEPTEIFDGLSIAESLAKDPLYVLDVIRLSFDQSSTS
jgi:hypothetical protein